MAIGRNRVIYQSELLAYSPTATGDNTTGPGMPSGIKRVQNANYSFTVNRQDIHQFGELARIDSMLLESPTVALDFTYYPLSGDQEAVLGFNVDPAGSFLSGMLKGTYGVGEVPEPAGGNFYILTTDEGTDAKNKGNWKDAMFPTEPTTTTIGIGNAEITDYTFDAAVGAIPTVSITAEGQNIAVYKGTGGDVPSVSQRDGTMVTGADGAALRFRLDPKNNLDGYTNDGASKFAALRPGDVTLNLNNSALLTDQVSGNSIEQGQSIDGGDQGAAHIQSFSLSVPMARTVLQRLGSNYGYARVLDVPLVGSFTVNALVSELKVSNLISGICVKDVDLDITIWRPECRTGDESFGNSERAMVWQIKGANLESEAISSSIGDNKTVDLTYNYNIGGPADTASNLLFSGAVNT